METTELSSPPSLLTQYARAVTTSLLPGGGEELPEDTLVLRDVKLEADHVAAYARVCGFAVRDIVPGTYPHVLGFPLQMKLMTQRSFPFSVLGLVHIANRIEVLAPIPVGSTLDYSLRTEDLRLHRRGRQFDMVVEAELGGETVWAGRSTYLRRGDGEGDGDGADSARAQAADHPRMEQRAVWRIPGDTGRRYAGVSGDSNPIHMHPLTARAFGFPSAIAHGMWSKARCLAAFDGRLPATYEVQCEFRSPLRIPAKAGFFSAELDDGYAFELQSSDGRHTHLTGSISGHSDSAVSSR